MTGTAKRQSSPSSIAPRRPAGLRDTGWILPERAAACLTSHSERHCYPGILVTAWRKHQQVHPSFCYGEGEGWLRRRPSRIMSLRQPSSFPSLCSRCTRWCFLHGCHRDLSTIRWLVGGCCLEIPPRGSLKLVCCGLGFDGGYLRTSWCCRCLRRTSPGLARVNFAETRAQSPASSSFQHFLSALQSHIRTV
jgi:hypothetical protein